MSPGRFLLAHELGGWPTPTSFDLEPRLGAVIKQQYGEAAAQQIATALSRQSAFAAQQQAFEQFREDAQYCYPTTLPKTFKREEKIKPTPDPYTNRRYKWGLHI